MTVHASTVHASRHFAYCPLIVGNNDILIG
jgi:hypothetical protein